VVIASRSTSRGVDCFVLTSGHTVSGAVGQRAIYALFGRHGSEGTKASATVVAHRETADLDVTLLRAESEDCVPARPGPAPRLGEPIWVITFPWGRSMLLAGGIVSQVRGDGAADGESVSRLMVDASVG
jgi:serine protease Do